MIREVIALGSGGSRIVMITQRRCTGGLALALDEGYLIIDPGPGSITSFNNLHLDPFKVRGVLISHAHPDHYNDAEIYIEAMTDGGNKKRGLLAVSKSITEPVYNKYPMLSSYHLKLPERVATLSPGEAVEYLDLKMQALKAVHYDPYTIGFKVSDGRKVVSYLPDTEFTPEVAEGVKSSDLLILNVLRPGNQRFKSHLCTADVIDMVKAANPRRVLMTNFGMKMIAAPPEREAKLVASSTGVEVIAATDGLKIDLSSTTDTGLDKWFQ